MNENTSSAEPVPSPPRWWTHVECEKCGHLQWISDVENCFEWVCEKCGKHNKSVAWTTAK